MDNAQARSELKRFERARDAVLVILHDEIQEIKNSLVTATPEDVSRLQGAARHLRRIINDLKPEGGNQ